MAVRLRLTRVGRKKRPYYRVVAADSSMPRDGRFLEILGTYDPLPNPSISHFKEERVLYWLKNGALPSERVSRLMKHSGLLQKFEEMKGSQAKSLG